MSYPRIPLAYVNTLVAMSEMRNGMPADKINVIGIAHHNEMSRSAAWSMDHDNSGHWFEMVTGLVKLYNDGPVDTMAVFYPTDDLGVSAGFLIEGGKPNMYLAWRHEDGKFAINLADGTQLSKAEGLETLKALLDRHSGAPLPGLPVTPVVNFAGLTGGTKPANQE